MRYETLPALLDAIDDTARLLGDWNMRFRVVRLQNGLGLLARLVDTLRDLTRH